MQGEIQQWVVDDDPPGDEVWSPESYGVPHYVPPTPPKAAPVSRVGESDGIVSTTSVLRHFPDDTVRKVCAGMPSGTFLRAYCETQSQVTDAPLAFHLASALSLLAIAAPTSHHMMHAGVSLRTNLYSLLVGLSGVARKTTCITHATQILEETGPEHIGGSPGSVQGLWSMLATEGRRLILEPDFSRFLMMAKSDTMAEVKYGYTELYDCLHRVKPLARETQVVASPRLSIYGGCAGDLLERLLRPEDVTGGFMSRYLFFVGERGGFRKPRGGDPQAQANLIWLHNVRMRAIPEHVAYLLDKEAEDRFYSWVESVDQRARQESDGSGTGGIITRATTAALKISMLLTMDFLALTLSASAERDVHTHLRSTIGLAAMDLAIQIAEACMTSSLSLATNLSPSWAMRERRDVLRMILTLTAKTGGATEGDIARLTRMTKKSLIPIIDTLLLEGTIESVGMSTDKGRVFRVKASLMGGY